MLLLWLVAVTTRVVPDFDQALTVFLAVSLAIELAVFVACCRRRPLALAVGALGLEEMLVISWLGGPFLAAIAGGWRLALFATGATLAAALLARIPLPEALFPVRGVWLRRLLAAAALAALLTGGPWQYVWLYAWKTAQPASVAHWLLALHLPLGCWVLSRTWLWLVRGLSRGPATGCPRRQPAL